MRRRAWAAALIHAMRVLLVAALLLAIPSPTAPNGSSGQSPPLGWAQSVMPAVATVASQSDSNGLWGLSDAEGETVGWLARSLPDAQDVVGYRGPTESMLLLDLKLNVVAIGLAGSSDTEEHVEAVLADDQFFKQFQGWPWGGPGADVTIDAVSGATLTSLALAEGVLKRIGGQRPSLVFPRSLTLQELGDWFSDAARIEEQDHEAFVFDGAGKKLGRVVRTGVLTDDLAGYQGPTELLLRIDENAAVVDIRIRSSFDNEPYVGYVRQEFGFWALFRSQSLESLSRLDPEEAGIEGVSGATMTSLAVADTIVAASQRWNDLANEPTAPTDPGPDLRGIRWASADLATLAILMVAALMSRWQMFRRPLLRRAWLWTVIVVIGLWAGNLVSLALVAGWSAEGVAWRLAPGLAAIAATALLVPPLSKGNPYCNHLCPHGAIQQLIRPRSRSRRRISLPRAVSTWLTRLPGVSLVLAYLALLFVPAVDLAVIEPFHAYLFRIASAAALLFALGTLVIAAFVPMAYCRLGCPTGRLIDYLRRTAHSDRVVKADFVALGLLATALLVRLTPAVFAA